MFDPNPLAHQMHLRELDRDARRLHGRQPRRDNTRKTLGDSRTAFAFLAIAAIGVLVASGMV